MELNLKGRVAVITGPAKGMGAAVTLGFAREGCRLALIGRDVAAIEPVVVEARALGAEAIVIACDITSGVACEAAMEKTRASFGGRIDILVNVAGGSGPIGKTGWETTEEEFDEIVHLNMRGCFNTMRQRIYPRNIHNDRSSLQLQINRFLTIDLRRLNGAKPI